MLISRTPFRITLGGGGTDLPSYYSKNGGFVVSMAINKYSYLTFKPDYFENLCKLRYSQIEIVTTSDKLLHTRAREALLLHEIYRGVEINSCSDLPSNSGMGSSGSYLVGLLKLIREFKKLGSDPRTIAEEACRIEIDILKEPVGKQDQYIAAFGGIKVLDISKNGNVEVQSVGISDNDMKEFLTNVHVYSINVQRNASDVLRDQEKMQGSTENLLNTIREYGYKTVEILESRNFDEYGVLLDNHWKLKKQLSNKISIELVDKLYEEVKENFGVLGGKIIGAGGGGFLMLYTPKNHKSLEEFMLKHGMWRLPYSVDYTGSRILGNFLENI